MGDGAGRRRILAICNKICIPGRCHLRCASACCAIRVLKGIEAGGFRLQGLTEASLLEHECLTQTIAVTRSLRLRPAGHRSPTAGRAGEGTRRAGLSRPIQRGRASRQRA